MTKSNLFLQTITMILGTVLALVYVEGDLPVHERNRFMMTSCYTGPLIPLTARLNANFLGVPIGWQIDLFVALSSAAIYTVGTIGFWQEFNNMARNKEKFYNINIFCAATAYIIVALLVADTILTILTTLLFGFSLGEEPELPSSHEESDIPLKEIRPTPIPIIRLSKQMSLDGSYKTSYETGNSIIAQETGYLKKLIDEKGVERQGMVQSGSYSYPDPLTGEILTVNYIADEMGFRAEGNHLPTPPPVPAEVQKGLDIIYESIRLQEEADARDLHNKEIEEVAVDQPHALELP